MKARGNKLEERANKPGGRATAQKNKGCYSPNVCSVLVAQLCLTLWDPMDCCPPGLFRPLDFPGKHTGVGSHFLLQRIFPTQESNQCLLHCSQILYYLSHLGSKTNGNKLTYFIEPMEDWGFGGTKAPKCFTQYANKFGKLRSGHRARKGQFSFQSQRRAKPKKVQLPHNCTHFTC